MPSGEQINERVDKLEEEQTRMRREEQVSPGLVGADAPSLEEVKVELDRLWDLLGQ